MSTVSTESSPPFLNSPASSSSKRRVFTAAFKSEIVLLLLTGQKSQAELCREHELSPNLLALWKESFVANAAAAFQSREQNSAEALRIAELERALGRATLENEILKKASRLLPLSSRRGSRS